MATGLPLPTCGGGRRSTTIKSVGVLRNPMVNREPRRKASAFTSIAASISTICPSIIGQEKSSRAIVGGNNDGTRVFGHRPAVTFAALIRRQIGITKALLYVLSQCTGAVTGALLLTLIIPPLCKADWESMN
jgi:hypothetical protein